MTKWIFLIFVSLLSNRLFAQEQRLQLDSAVFESMIENHTWSLEDKEALGKDRIFVIGFTSDTLVISYLNDAEGVKNVYCKYELKFDRDIAQIYPYYWQSLMNPVEDYQKEKPQYIYCYLDKYDVLQVRFSKKHLSTRAALESKTAWMELLLVKP